MQREWNRTEVHGASHLSVVFNPNSRVEETTADNRVSCSSTGNLEGDMMGRKSGTDQKHGPPWLLVRRNLWPLLFTDLLSHILDASQVAARTTIFSRSSLLSESHYFSGPTTGCLPIFHRLMRLQSTLYPTFRRQSRQIFSDAGSDRTLVAWSYRLHKDGGQEAAGSQYRRLGAS